MHQIRKHLPHLFLLAFVLLVAFQPAYAQQGCVNSPENPTAVLFVIGSIGVGFSMKRQHLLSKIKAYTKRH